MRDAFLSLGPVQFPKVGVMLAAGVIVINSSP